MYVAPSASKWAAASTRWMSPSVILVSGITPNARGERDFTVTEKTLSMLPPAFVAVTVTIALPAASGVRVSRPPDSQRCTMPPGVAATP